MGDRRDAILRLRGKSKRGSNPETLSPAGMSSVRTEHKLFSCLDTNIRKNLWRIKASVTSGRIKKSRSFFSVEEVHPAVLRFRASRRMNLLNTEIEHSSRYEFLILKIDWNMTKNLFSYSFCFVGSSVGAVMCVSADGSMMCIAPIHRRCSHAHRVK